MDTLTQMLLFRCIIERDGLTHLKSLVRDEERAFFGVRKRRKTNKRKPRKRKPKKVSKKKKK